MTKSGEPEAVAESAEAEEAPVVEPAAAKGNVTESGEPEAVVEAAKGNVVPWATVAKGKSAEPELFVYSSVAAKDAGTSRHYCYTYDGVSIAVGAMANNILKPQANKVIKSGRNCDEIGPRLSSWRF
eukprot:9120602-Pyramimonas_sp.AAC.1